MYSKIILDRFISHKNSGRISKPDGIAVTYNEDTTAHVEFSLRIENEKITLCQFRAQANPYIIAVCSMITDMVVGSDINTVSINAQMVKSALEDDSSVNIDFCIDCFYMAIQDYLEEKGVVQKEKKTTKKEPKLADILNILETSTTINEEISEQEDIDEEISSLEESTRELVQETESKQETNLQGIDLDDDDFIFDDDDLLDLGVDFLTLPKSDKN